MHLDQEYWNERYLAQNTPWNTGLPTPPLQKIIDGLADQQTKILIPGAGEGQEARYLHEKGFQQVYVCDWAEEALRQFAEKTPNFPSDHLIQGDFFDISDTFDLILEQTFFCALPPALRPVYAEKTAALLHNQGRLRGLLFANPFPFEGPPFGGTKTEYQNLFSPFFLVQQLEICQHSIPPRLGNELVFDFIKK